MNFSRFVAGIGKLIDSDPVKTQQLRNYSYNIIGCCQEVHKEMGPFLNEYMYQDALDICLEEKGYVGENKIKEYYFTTSFHGKTIRHRHKVDFLVNKNVLVECKAVEALDSEHRQQLWNYMRLSGIRIGILYNFAPVKDQCERYYYDSDKQMMLAF